MQAGNAALTLPFLPAFGLTGWRRTAALGIIVGAGALLSAQTIATAAWDVRDWAILSEAGQRIRAGLDPYAAEINSFRYSPLVAWLFAIIEPIGAFGWTLVGLALLGLLRDWRWVLVFACAFPYWRDIATGLSFAYVPILAIVALRGSTAASLALAGLAILVPRPLMLVLVGWLLWQRPALRAPVAVIAALLLAGSVATGWAGAWVAELASIGAMQNPAQYPIMLWLGPLWLALLPVAGWLTLRGHLGWASLAISPYWTAAYPLVLALELPWARSMTRRTARSASRSGSSRPMAAG